MAENNPAMPDQLAGAGMFLRFAIRATILGQSHLNYLFYQIDQDLQSASSLKQAAIDVWGQLTPAWTDFVSSDWSIQNIVVRRVDIYASPSYFVLQSELAALLQPVTGAQGVSCPPQDAAVFRKRTGQAGKRGRGRLFISGIAEADQTGGELTAAAQTRAQTLCTALQQTFAGTTGVNFAPFHMRWIERPPPALTTLEGRFVESVDFDTVVRTQRRRQLGRGI